MFLLHDFLLYRYDLISLTLLLVNVFNFGVWFVCKPTDLGRFILSKYKDNISVLELFAASLKTSVNAGMV